MFEVQLDDGPVKELGDVELSEQLVDLTRVIERLQARQLEMVGEWDSRSLWAFDGCAKAPQWLTQHTEMAPSQAASVMWLARRLRRDMPTTRRALAEGTLSVAKSKVLAEAVNDRTRAAFSEHEPVLVQQAKNLTVKQLQVAVNHWKLRADQDGAVPAEERLRDKRCLFSHRLPDGTWKIDGQLDPESGEIVNAELHRICELLFRSEQADTDDPDRQPLTGGQRRADALVEMARRSASYNGTASAQPMIFVRMDLATLLGYEGEASLNDGQTPIPSETARRLACDSNLVRVIMRTGNEVLELGRGYRTATPGQRRALILRDGPCCVMPGCDIPHDFCQAHHLEWWERGGLTDLANMAMVCNRHHHLLHEGKWTLTRETDGRFRAHSPPRS